MDKVWTAHAKKVPKDYGYIKDLQKRALKMLFKDKIGMRRKMELETEDPRRVSDHLSPVEPKKKVSWIKITMPHFLQIVTFSANAFIDRGNDHHRVSVECQSTPSAIFILPEY